MMLFPSTLIIGKNPKLSEESVKTLLVPLNHRLDHNPDLLIIDQNSGWGIDVIRTINTFLCQKPYSHSSRVILIRQLENLETEAQNALLKNLEEPGVNRFFILTATNPKLILSTIISRCHLISTSNSPNLNSHSVWSLPENIKEILAMADSLNADKSLIKALLQEQLQINQQLLLNSADPKIADTINLLIKSIDLINHHVDPKSALDYYLLKQI
ncbi:MAG: hypothetical protein AAB574_02510 [Patescibacteria group bacterium]